MWDSTTGSLQYLGSDLEALKPFCPPYRDA